MQFDAEVNFANDRALTASNRAATLAQMTRQADAAREMVDAFKAQASLLSSRQQEMFAELFKQCLATRQQSLTTSSSDSVLSDVMRDALFMAQSIWPTYKAQMDALA
jgi:ribosomal protein L16 Arg81 hydroxylase